eukprot:Gb_16171 [translate_table: standard]
MDASAAGDIEATFSARLSRPNSSAFERRPIFSMDERVKPNSSAFERIPAFSSPLNTFFFSNFFTTSTSTASSPSRKIPAPNHCFFQLLSYVFTCIAYHHKNLLFHALSFLILNLTLLLEDIEHKLPHTWEPESSTPN